MFAKHPDTVKDLQISLRLKSYRNAEALVQVHDVKEAARIFMNRCLGAAGSLTKELPDWKDVDNYMQHVRLSFAVRRAQKTLAQAVDEDCKVKPYDLMPHTALFCLRIMDFLRTAEGGAYDVCLDPLVVRRREDVQFDRCIRILHLLGFFVNQHRETKRAREAEKIREAIGDNWI
ncbi:uncharacterized protein F4812DRAFT_188921 [Daldinia caldariorum]|uniref:uncharacterized protein n=1 Tax=Daldinia caldariorum TaxID=326644 RepID=UPI0020075C52|nr:uncharacterized protein F4812DRAFT_188921 [Daldinia caldariorum]KAI1471696.1 hypothetical protein F4812DRAFT_188921 [Daldinia caldariorum]